MGEDGRWGVRKAARVSNEGFPRALLPVNQPSPPPPHPLNQRSTCSTASQNLSEHMCTMSAHCPPPSLSAILSDMCTHPMHSDQLALLSVIRV